MELDARNKTKLIEENRSKDQRRSVKEVKNEEKIDQKIKHKP